MFPAFHEHASQKNWQGSPTAASLRAARALMHEECPLADLSRDAQSFLASSSAELEVLTRQVCRNWPTRCLHAFRQNQLGGHAGMCALLQTSVCTSARMASRYTCGAGLSA
jgi:hypothetical protein